MDPHSDPTPSALDRAFEELEARGADGFEIYRRRKLTGGKAPTLQELANEWGISRERVRQLENRFGAQLSSDVVKRPENPIAAAARRLAELLGPVFRGKADEAAMWALGSDAKPLLAEEHRVLLVLGLAGPYEREKEWLFRKGFRDESEELLEQMTAEAEFASLADVGKRFSEVGLREEDLLPWIAHLGGHQVVGEYVARLGRTLADRGVTILKIRGRPMTLEEVFDELNEERSIRSFKNQIQADPRVRRRGVKHYGLLEWGGEEYTTVADEMTQAIEGRGGAADLDELGQELSDRFGISPASVRMYAAGAQFALDDANTVRVSMASSSPNTKPLALTRCCFRLAEGWAFRRTVDHDVMRGSGTAIPLGFAKEIGLEPGAATQLVTPYGPLRCSWPSHMAYVGSLRKVALAFDASEGDYLFIIAVSEGHADFRHVRATECQAITGLGRLALECGAADPSPASIADALGSDSAGRASAGTRIRQWLVQRNEPDLVALVPGDDEDDLLEVLVDL